MEIVREKNYKVKNKLSEFKTRVIMKDLMLVFTYPGGPKKLSAEQVKGLLSGTVKNWKEVGGEDKPVVLVTSLAQPGTQKYIEDKVINQKMPVGTGKTLPAHAGGVVELMKTVIETPGSVGITTKAGIDSSVNIPEQPEIARPVTVFFIGKPNPNMDEYFKFINSAGPELGVYR